MVEPKVGVMSGELLVYDIDASAKKQAAQLFWLAQTTVLFSNINDADLLTFAKLV